MWQDIFSLICESLLKIIVSKIDETRYLKKSKNKILYTVPSPITFFSASYFNQKGYFLIFFILIGNVGNYNYSASQHRDEYIRSVYLKI